MLGIDFEDWFHPELIQRHITDKNNKPTVVQGIDKILDWLRKNDTFATFFTVGELLESKPELLDKILGNGHEIAFHTMHHTRLDAPNFREKFDEEIKRFADLTKGKSRGFRAPTFSMSHYTSWAIDILAKNNYQYDSSIVPAKTKLYGIANAETKPYKISSGKLEGGDPGGKILEFPLLTTTIFGKRIPAGGGFYLRCLPLRIIKKAIRNCNKENAPATFYIHSWELTPEFMPKIQLPFVDRFITYHNLDKAF
ncbi:polysaccharide deacetylase family protein [Candidatus Nitrosotenuis chungbukensis]|uniref:polysaccharide deacetylase family protein n=1 Tax=Candidatus Nitrosotenuis chungbukensis TaxID=1353246 RepID=UPI002673A2D0|nr:polysaccharide deacetylase family protein [Candidatus Nitrosotenuis chungbukensis]WKT58315.1 polysaccharide deacetylase family protein [Candidatus Nitrosotenuis chungbukensis]